MYIDFYITNKGGICLILRIIAIVLAFMAIALNFRGEWIIKKVFKTDSPSPNSILKAKFIALIIAIIAFLLVFLS